MARKTASVRGWEWRALWSWDRRMTLLSLLRLPLLVASPYLGVYMPRLILRQLQAAPAFWDFLWPILLLLCAMAAVRGASQYLEGMSRYRANTFVNYLLPMIDCKTLDMDYEQLESAAGQLARQKAMNAVYQGGGSS